MDETSGPADARLHLKIDPAIDRQLRVAAAMLGLNLSEAVEEAIPLWIAERGLELPNHTGAPT